MALNITSIQTNHRQARPSQGRGDVRDKQCLSGLLAVPGYKYYDYCGSYHRHYHSLLMNIEKLDIKLLLHTH